MLSVVPDAVRPFTAFLTAVKSPSKGDTPDAIKPRSECRSLLVRVRLTSVGLAVIAQHREILCLGRRRGCGATAHDRHSNAGGSTAPINVGANVSRRQPSRQNACTRIRARHHPFDVCDRVPRAARVLPLESDIRAPAVHVVVQLDRAARPARRACSDRPCSSLQSPSSPTRHPPALTGRPGTRGSSCSYSLPRETRSRAPGYRTSHKNRATRPMR